MIDVIENVLPQQVIASTNKVFDKNSENAKADKSNQRVEEKTTKKKGAK